MFDTPADASSFLQSFFERPVLEAVVGALEPTLVIETDAGPVEPGSSRIGGEPDGPAGLEWPRPPRPADPGEIAARGNEAAGREMLAHIEQDLPYAFIAQVDLSAIAGVEPAADLPSEGRLLFFYDLAVGPWDTGTRAGKVIHDTTPAGELSTLDVPAALAGADEEQRRLGAEFRAEMDAEDGEDADLEPASGTIYRAPERAAQLRAALQMPSPYVWEISRLPRLEAAARGTGDVEGEDLLMAYQEAMEEIADEAPARLLGLPQPEQDDPRYDAVIVSHFEKQHLSREEWNEHRDFVLEGAREWRLLFQFSVGGWMMDDFGTGTVYYLIREEDLRRERFDDVVTVYQQT